MPLQRMLCVSVLVTMLTFGCSSREEQPASTGTPPPLERSTRQETIVVVPENVKGKWKSVQIAVTDKTAGREAVYTVKIGGSVTIPGSQLTITVETFLPHFVMEGTMLTSLTNEPNNPAVLIRVVDEGRETFKGWLFALYPTTHAFQHPRYGLSLVDFVPAGKKDARP